MTPSEPQAASAAEVDATMTHSWPKGMPIAWRQGQTKDDAAEQPASAQPSSDATPAKPEPGDAVQVALRKMFPQGTLDTLQAAAGWLEDKFGVQEYADLEALAGMADTVVGFIADDPDLDAGAKGVLQELLGKLSGDDEPTSPLSAGPTSPALAPAEADTRPRTIRNGDFLVLKELGKGSFATVHCVEERGSQKRFALKEIDTIGKADAVHRAQVQQEREVHLGLDHPHLLKCYEVFEELGAVFFVLELVEGGDLDGHMKRERTLAEAEAARLFAEVTSGVHCLHLKGVMHRDLKPENVLLDCERHAKIADFGCCAKASEIQTQECGSPAYFAPEMIAGGGYDQRVDVWTLGILLYEMLVGFSPFASALTEKETKQRILKVDFGYGAWLSVPALAQPLLKAILSREPDERPELLAVLSDAWVRSHAGAGLSSAAEALAQKQKEEPAGV